MFLNQMWEEELLDKELFSQDGTQSAGKILRGIVGLFTTQTIESKDQATYSILPPFKGPDGHRMVTPALPVVRDIGTFAITKVNKHPEATIRWIDHFYGDEGSIWFRFGGKEEFYYFRVDGKPDHIKEWYENPDKGIGAVVAQHTAWPGGITPHWISERNSITVAGDFVSNAQKAIEPYMPPVSYQKPILETEVQESISILTNDLFTYGLEMQFKFITGELSFDKWDDYVRVIEKIGLKEYEEVYQKAFDKVIGK